MTNYFKTLKCIYAPTHVLLWLMYACSFRSLKWQNWFKHTYDHQLYAVKIKMRKRHKNIQIYHYAFVVKWFKTMLCSLEVSTQQLFWCRFLFFEKYVSIVVIFLSNFRYELYFSRRFFHGSLSTDEAFSRIVLSITIKSHF